MKYRIAIWAAVGFLVASGWAVYFFLKNKDLPIEPLVSALLRLTCPIAIVGMHHPVSIYSSLAAMQWSVYWWKPCGVNLTT